MSPDSPFLYSLIRPCHTGGEALPPLRQFANSPLIVIHTHLRLQEEPLCNSHRKPALWLLKRRDGTCHDDVGVFTRCFPSVPPVNINPQTVHNHMDAVTMCSVWNPNPPNILESYIFPAKLHNDIIAISKLEAVWLPHSRHGGCFPGESSLKSRSRGLTVTVIYFHHKHLVS